VGKDADDPSTPNGRLDFAITQGNKDGRLNSKKSSNYKYLDFTLLSGIFELRQLDAWNAQIFASKSLRNRFGNYSLTITTRDMGLPANIVHSTLDICVSDFNDHAPVFVRPLHNTTVRIPENATVGTLILQAFASDADMGQNALVRYRLKPDPLGSYKMFEVNANSGELFLREPLNREKQKIHEVCII